MHALMQAGAKLVTAPEPQQMTLVLAWMGVGMTVPWLAFLVRASHDVPSPTAALPSR